MGVAREGPALGRCGPHPFAAGPRLVDDAYDATARSSGQLCVALCVRLLWRWFNPVPERPGGLKPWERVAAHVGHISLYVLMFIVSLTGWMVATTFRVPMTKDLLGLNVPPIVTTVDRSVRQWIEGSHMVLAYLLAGLVLIHNVGALRHHMLKHNDVLRRMIWSARV
jgi:cytochrome b561